MSQDLTLKESKEDVERRQKATLSLKKNIRVSDAQLGTSIPAMLMVAPRAASLLGHIKLLSFSDNGLLIELTEPEGGFKYLTRRAFPAAMMQTLDQARTCFNLAENNLRSIHLKTNDMLGRGGHVAYILQVLQDPLMAKKSLKPSIQRLRDAMHLCYEQAQAVEGAFQLLVDLLREVTVTLSHDAGIEERSYFTETAKTTQRLEQQAKIVEERKNLMEQRAKSLENQLAEAEEHYNFAQGEFRRAAKKGELSTMALTSVRNAGRSTSKLLNSGINLIQETPRMAIEVAQAASNTLKFTGNTIESSFSPRPAAMAGGQSSIKNDAQNQARAPALVDMALQSAEELDVQLGCIKVIFEQDSPTDVGDAIKKIRASVDTLKDLQNRLGAADTKHAISVRRIIEKTIQTTDAAVKQVQFKPLSKKRAWNENVANWRLEMQSPLYEASKLRAYAATQPGQGFESSLDAALKDPSPGDSTYAQVLRERYQKLLIMREAMQDSRSNLQANREAQLMAQSQVRELNAELHNMEHNKLTMDDTKEILRKAISAIIAMQDDFSRLTQFFGFLTDHLDMIKGRPAEQLLETLPATEKGGNTSIKFTKVQIEILRETLVTLSAHFGFVVKAAALYEEVATEHINPCLQKMAFLPVGASGTDQEKAKEDLKTITDASSKAIEELARKELDRYLLDFEGGLKEIDDELRKYTRALPELESDTANLQAIQEGVSEVREESAQHIQQQPELYEETAMDDDF
ncbi:uncharacterized protein J7T55_010383 [Diaporthe amygdali]|uniref:uncharacterized protein n=1 Tax=Phomopsis amygdali TaxID=1214568 RepID=UPI0022FE70AD|nr:uncharacterized protein J7T55_010383 [Diaporthe amygdali]KAJ0115561.1 uncharacterized protein J7T55_010383 [Diaporthe amygdali]